MLDLFPDQPVYAYPQLVNLIYSFSWAFVLASMIAITHRLTFTGDHYPKNFFQALILGALITTMLMMAIGDSLARGLGVFGAMAIIRFRTRIDDPRDVLFLFAALSTGLAIGVYGFSISFVGALLFCAVAVVLHLSPFKSHIHHSLLFFTLKDTSVLPQVKEVIRQHCNDFRMVNMAVNKENAVRYRYTISLKKNKTKEELMEGMRQLSGVGQIRIAANELNLP